MIRRLPADDSRIELPQSNELRSVRGLFRKVAKEIGFMSSSLGGWKLSGPFRFRFAVDAFFALLLDAGQNSANRSPARRALARPERFRQAIEKFSVHAFRLCAVRFAGEHFSPGPTVTTFMTPRISSFLLVVGGPLYPLIVTVPRD